MDIPPATSLVWRDLITGKRHLELKFLAAKVMMGRLMPLAARAPESLPQCASELRELLAKNAHLPSVQGDLKTILG